MVQVSSYSVYPGEYIPLPEVEAGIENLKTLHKNSKAKLPANLDEFDDFFRLEMIIPGSRREEIFIYSHEDVLSVVVMHREADRLQKGMLHIHEFDSMFVTRDILLPANADIEFITAEYTQGKLVVNIPKTTKPSPVATKQVVVY